MYVPLAGHLKGVEVPSRELLRLHAAVAGVLNLSGAAEILDFYKDRSGTGEPAVRSHDGEGGYVDRWHKHFGNRTHCLSAHVYRIIKEGFIADGP